MIEIDDKLIPIDLVGFEHRSVCDDVFFSVLMFQGMEREALAGKPEAHALLQMRVGGLRALSEVGG